MCRGTGRVLNSGSCNETKWMCLSPCAQANRTALCCNSLQWRTQTQRHLSLGHSDLSSGKGQADRRGQERTGHFSRQRWQRVERAQCWWVSAPSRGSQALLHGQQCAVDSFVLPWSNFHSIHSSAESQREHTWGMTTQETYFVYSLLRSVLPGLWCLWLWQRQLLLNSTHGEPNMTKPCYKKRTYKEMMRLWWNRVITLEKKEINTTEVAISVKNSACLGHNQGTVSGSKLGVFTRQAPGPLQTGGRL